MEEGSLKLVLPGTPYAQSRPRFAHKGKFTQVYDPQKLIKQSLKMYLFAQCDAHGYKMKEDRLYLIDFKFMIAFPKGSSKAKLRDQEMALWHGAKDLDNFLKFYLDLMTGVIYADDHFVAQLTASKHRSKETRTEIEVRWRDLQE